jgi:hypothetical protein
MDLFTKLFGNLLALVYHCFDRIVILGHLPLLTRPENMVHFFRDVHGIRAITKEVLRARTDDYNRWVESFARNHQIPIEWAEKGVRKEDYVRPALRRMERRNRGGVYFIRKSMEVGATFRSAVPKYPTADPDYRILSRQRCRYTHYYFYIRDDVLGPLALCVGSFLPFAITYYLNGHHFIERELRRAGGRFARTITPFSGSRIAAPSRRPPIGSALRSCESGSTTGPGWWPPSSPPRTATPSTSAATTRSSRWSIAAT